MRLSTRQHALLDLATAGAALALPRLLGVRGPITRALTGVALGKLAYGLVTRHELGVAKLIPMRAHLLLDALGGAALCTLPWVTDGKDRRAVACALGLGLVDLAAAPLTDPSSGPTDGARTTRPADASPEGWRRLAGGSDPLPSASPTRMFGIASRVMIPTVARGPIIRRPVVMARAEKKDHDLAAVRTLQEIRARYGPGPVLLRQPLRDQAILLEPEQVRRVLEETPEPFSPASTEKQAALAHFEPEVSLVSHGEARERRRRLNEEALETPSPVHAMAEGFLPIVYEEAERLLRRAGREGALAWEAFSEAWFAVVRRVVFGNAARNDLRTTELMTELRSDANWAWLKPRRTRLRDELHARIRAHIERAEPGSLAAHMASKVRSEDQKPEQQIPQWLFAFDPAGMATFRALGLLATHPDQRERARDEIEGGPERAHRPLLRAALLESLRLWPTTPMILRQTTRETEWDEGVMPANTGVLIFTPLFHRDDERLPYAHVFHPDLWTEDDPDVQGFPPGAPRKDAWHFVPFSGGPAHCPGQNLVLLLTSGMLAAVLDGGKPSLTQPERMRPGSLPGSQNHFTLRFAVQA